ncbi:MAG: hypothetical protein KH828_07940 [Clostridiales bacterium]|nr:hypothetical protein [Clostridiales bacterium]
MNIKKSIFKIFNGTSWDEYYHKTSADQVVYTKPDGTASTAQAELDAQNSALKEYIKIIEVTTEEATIPANSGKNFPRPIKNIDGYKYLATIEAVPNGQASIISQTNGWSYNPTSTDKTISVTYVYLYIKS